MAFLQVIAVKVGLNDEHKDLPGMEALHLSETEHLPRTRTSHKTKHQLSQAHHMTHAKQHIERSRPAAAICLS